MAGNDARRENAGIETWMKKKNQPISTSSAASEDSLSPQSGQGSGQSGSARSTATARASSRKTFWRTPDSGSHGNQATPTKCLLNGTARPNQQIRLADQVAMDALGSSPTSEISTEETSPASRSSQGDFLASHSVAPGSAEARKMTV